MNARTLSLPISTLDYKQPTTVQVGSPVSDAIDIMQAEGFGCILVVDSEQRLAGILTDRDLLLHVCGKRLDPTILNVEDIMTSTPESLRASDPIAFALNLMHLGHFRHVPLCIWDDQHQEFPIGLISTRDILDHMAIFIENQQGGA
ncbi:MAG: CBS domain-containing protein [Candidatus Poribacteria bacterium]|nr:CBS domain-containing protein [Candidatus Poribacteria bacterium]